MTGADPALDPIILTRFEDPYPRFGGPFVSVASCPRGQVMEIRRERSAHNHPTQFFGWCLLGRGVGPKLVNSLLVVGFGVFHRVRLLDLFDLRDHDIFLRSLLRKIG